VANTFLVVCANRILTVTLLQDTPVRGV
jgi:hypothetical protein